MWVQIRLYSTALAVITCVGVASAAINYSSMVGQQRIRSLKPFEPASVRDSAGQLSPTQLESVLEFDDAQNELDSAVSAVSSTLAMVSRNVKAAVLKTPVVNKNSRNYSSKKSSKVIKTSYGKSKYKWHHSKCCKCDPCKPHSPACY